MKMNYSKKIRKCIKAIIATFVAIITLFSTSTLANAAENYDGSWAYSYESQSVYSDYTETNKIGTVYAYEGFTVLYHTAGHPYIEYSTSDGAKRGYILGFSIVHISY